MGQMHSVTNNGKKREHGPVEVSLDELPKYGLVGRSMTAGAIHRISMGRDMQTFEDTELLPACCQGDIPQQTATGGTEYQQEWKRVTLEHRLPFEKYKLCDNPRCFRWVAEIVE